MKKFSKKFLLYFCIQPLFCLNYLSSIEKSPILQHKGKEEAWHFKTYGADNTFNGKTGSCVSTTKKEIKEIYAKLLQLLKCNKDLFIELTWININIYTNVTEKDVADLKELKLLDSSGKTPKIVSKLLDLIVVFDGKKAEIKKLDDLFDEKIEQIL